MHIIRHWHTQWCIVFIFSLLSIHSLSLYLILSPSFSLSLSISFSLSLSLSHTLSHSLTLSHTLSLSLSLSLSLILSLSLSFPFSLFLSLSLSSPSQCTCLFVDPPSMSHYRRMIYFSATANLRIVEEQWHRRGRRTRYADFLCHLRLPRDYSINHFAKSLTALRKESYSFKQHHCPSLPASVTVLFPSSLGLSPPLSFTSFFIKNRLSSFIPPFR